MCLVVGCAETREADLVGTTSDAIASDADVEIKLMVQEVETGPDLVNAKDPQKREIRFYDTQSLTLFNEGTILRSRHKKDEPDDSTVKLRPLQASSVSADMFDHEGFKCELDKGVGASAVSSCSFTTEQSAATIENADEEHRDIPKVFTRDQLAYLDEHAAVDWKTVKSFGPIEAEVWTVTPDSLDNEEVTLERWDVPGGQRSLEVSIKVKGRDAAALEKKLVEWAESKGLHRSTTQETKTKAALKALAAR